VGIIKHARPNGSGVYPEFWLSQAARSWCRALHGSAEVARGDPPLLPDFQHTDQIKVTPCCVLNHSMVPPGLSMLCHVYSHRGRINSVISGAFPRHFSLCSGTRQRAPTFSGPENTLSARIHIYDQETIVYGITSSVPGGKPCRHRVVLARL
jgi:hypothetical protein